MEKKNKYDDIINLPHHVSTRHVHMSLHDRAAQFAPFAALTGHGVAVEETARLTEEKPEIDEEEKNRLDEKMQFLMGKSIQERNVTITYFQPDGRKSGGAYISCAGKISRLDNYRGQVIMEDGTYIPFFQILDIDSPLFNEIQE